VSGETVIDLDFNGFTSETANVWKNNIKIPQKIANDKTIFGATTAVFT